MDESEVKGVTDDVVVSVNNESKEHSAQDGTNDNAVNVSVKKGVTDEIINKNQPADSSSGENVEVVKNGNVTESNSCLTPQQETEEKEEVQIIEGGVVELSNNDVSESEMCISLQPEQSSVISDSNGLEQPVVEACHSVNNPPENGTVQENENFVNPAEQHDIMESNDKTIDKKEVLPEGTDEDIDTVEQPIKEEGVETKMPSEEIIPPEISQKECSKEEKSDIPEQNVDVIAEETAVVKEPNEVENKSNDIVVSQQEEASSDCIEVPKESVQDDAVINTDEETIISTSMVSHMISLPEESSSDCIEVHKESVQDDAVSNTDEKTTISTSMVSHMISLPEESSSDSIEVPKESVEDGAVRNTDEETTISSSMVSHMIALPEETPGKINTTEKNLNDIEENVESVVSQDGVGVESQPLQECTGMPPPEDKEDTKVESIIEDQGVKDSEVVEVSSGLTVVNNEVENGTHCSSMVSHMVLPSSEPLEVDDDKEGKIGITDEPSIISPDESNVVESVMVQNPDTTEDVVVEKLNNTESEQEFAPKVPVTPSEDLIPQNAEPSMTEIDTLEEKEKDKVEDEGAENPLKPEIVDIAQKDVELIDNQPDISPNPVSMVSHMVIPSSEEVVVCPSNEARDLEVKELENAPPTELQLDDYVVIESTSATELEGNKCPISEISESDVQPESDVTVKDIEIPESLPEQLTVAEAIVETPVQEDLVVNELKNLTPTELQPNDSPIIGNPEAEEIKNENIPCIEIVETEIKTESEVTKVDIEIPQPIPEQMVQAETIIKSTIDDDSNQVIEDSNIKEEEKIEIVQCPEAKGLSIEVGETLEAQGDKNQESGPEVCEKISSETEISEAKPKAVETLVPEKRGCGEEETKSSEGVLNKLPEQELFEAPIEPPAECKESEIIDQVPVDDSKATLVATLPITSPEVPHELKDVEIDKDEINKEEEISDKIETNEASNTCNENASEILNVDTTNEDKSKEEEVKLDVQTNVTLPEEDSTASLSSEKERIIAIEVLDKVEDIKEIEVDQHVETLEVNGTTIEEVIEPSEGDVAPINMSSNLEEHVTTSTMDIPITKEQPVLTSKEVEGNNEANTSSKENVIELISTQTQEQCSDKDPDTKIEHSKDESLQCSVEKEIIESEEGGPRIERTKTCEEQIIRETKKQTTVSETVETLTAEELFERFPELRGTILNQPSQHTQSEVVEGGTGTFEDPKTVTSNQEESRVTSGPCPDDKDATMIHITSSSLTKQTMQASSSSKSDGQDKGTTDGKVPSPPARKQKPSESEATSKENGDANPNVVNVPINVEADSSIVETTKCEEVGTPAVAVEKTPEAVKNPVPPPRSANAQSPPPQSQQGICCIIL